MPCQRRPSPPPETLARIILRQPIGIIKSPMVGTFYAAPDPESPPYVKVGDHVGPETTVCIVEAMKVFNQIPAEVSGKIVAVLVENGNRWNSVSHCSKWIPAKSRDESGGGISCSLWAPRPLILYRCQRDVGMRDGFDSYDIVHKVRTNNDVQTHFNCQPR